MKWGDKIITAVILLIALGMQILTVRQFSSLLWLSLVMFPFLFSTGAVLLIRSEKIKRIINLYRFLVLLMGPFATIGCLLILVFTPRKRIAEEYRSFLAADTVFSPSERLQLGQKFSFWQTGDEEITPYVDIMESRNSLMKRNTINKVVQHPGPNSRPILDIGLNDRDPDIRFYAASALILLNDNFINEFRSLQEKIEKDPENAALHFELASAYDRYCSWQLPESEDLPNYYAKIETAYGKSLALRPKNLNTIVGLVRVLIKQKNFQKASQIIEQGVQSYPNSANLILQQMKLLFRQKKIIPLKQLVKNYLADFSNIPLEVQEAVSYWANIKASK